MKLIVGLGNPGRLYTDTRHNIGFTVARQLALSYKGSFKKEARISALSARIKIKNQHVVLALPLTFMNSSGEALKPLIEKYRIGLESLLVVCDDLDLEFTRLKIRPCGSAGGQKGLESIINAINSQDFSRLRIGIGRPPRNIEAAEYVLAPFKRQEKEELGDICVRALDCCRAWVTDGIVKSMELFNRGGINE